MTSRLEELFSPDRLRQNWEKPVMATTLLRQNTLNQDIHSHYFVLQRLITEKYPDATWLSATFEDLTEKINLAFGLDATESPDAKQKELIVTILEELEELLSAMDLPNRGGE